MKRLSLKQALVLAGLTGTLAFGGLGALAWHLTPSAVALAATPASNSAATQQKPAKQPGKHGRDGAIVKAISGQQLTLARRDGSKEVVNVTNSTVVTRAGQPSTFAAIQVGSAIRVVGTASSDGSVTATRIDIHLPTFQGQVSAVNGSSLTIKTRNGSAKTVQVNSSTVYTELGKTVQASTIQVGTKIGAAGTLNSDGSLTAVVVHVELPKAGGQVTAINRSTLTVSDRKVAHAIVTSGATTYSKAGQSASFSDIHTGDRIRAEGTLNSDGSLTALRVQIELPRVGGQVSAVNGDTITTTGPKGTQTIHVTGSTIYQIGAPGGAPTTASLSQVQVSKRIHAEGTLNSDGSLTALVVRIEQ